MRPSDDDVHRLYYWPSIPGRGEFVRLALEESGMRYVDVARLPASEGGGADAITRVLGGELGGLRPFAPPVLVRGELVIAQTAAILDHLAASSERDGHHPLAPSDPGARLEALQTQLTIADLVAETHDVHHPIGASLYYADQRDEAARRALLFRRERAAKFLNYFEDLAQHGGGEHLVAGAFTYVDLSIAHVLDGLAYAFPGAFTARWSPTIPTLLALRDRVHARPRIAAYLASSRRIAMNEHGIFRHYPELDDPA
ncbi:MAG: glutathione S-transferase [Myxococcota bacterium]|nr:glutathione S-transferase [Myxococcota bacterium]